MLTLEKHKYAYTKSITEVKMQVRDYYRALDIFKERITLAGASLAEALLLMSDSSQGYMYDQITLETLRTIMNHLKQAQANYRQSMFQHLSVRLELALIAGLSKLPGHLKNSSIP